MANKTPSGSGKTTRLKKTLKGRNKKKNFNKSNPINEL